MSNEIIKYNNVKNITEEEKQKILHDRFQSLVQLMAQKEILEDKLMQLETQSEIDNVWDNYNNFKNDL